MKRFFSLLVILPFFSHGQTITTFAGNGVNSYAGDGGQATAAAISIPGGLAVDIFGNIYISGYGNNTIRKVSPSGIITTYAGNGTAGFSGDGGQATNAQLSSPTKMAIDLAGNLYFADKENNRVRKISTTGIITTVAGNGIGGFSSDGIPATSSQLHEPTGVAVDASGNIYIADYTNNRIRKVSTAGIISTYAGTGVAGSSGDGGQATNAQLNGCHGVVVDGSGNLYIADQVNNKIRKITTSGVISTFAGTGAAGFFGDGGPATAAKFNIPGGVFVDNSNNVYVADELNFRIRKISSSGVVSTICGNGSAGYIGDGMLATATELNYANEIILDLSGNFLIVDNNNFRVRKFSSCQTFITHQPKHDTVVLGNDAMYTVTTSMPSPAYQWQEDPGTGFVDLVNVPPYSGVNTDTLIIHNAIMLLNTTHYRCVITNPAYCTDTSSSAILIVQSTSFVNPPQITSINVFPNPTKGKITITVPQLNCNWMVIVTDVVGNVISSTTNNATQFDINMNVDNGFYLIKLFNILTHETILKKVIVQK